MKKSYLLIKEVCLLFAFVLLLQSSTLPASAQEPAQQSLYDRLGGAYAIAAVVDDFIDRLLTDPVVTANKSVTAAMEHITKAGLKFYVTEMICEAAGGPQKYSGRPMKESHQGLNISETEWAASVKDFITTLTKFKVSGKEQGELLTIVSGTKADIVIAKKEETRARDILQGQMAVEVPPPAQAEPEMNIPQPLPGLPDLPGLPKLPSGPGQPPPTQGEAAPGEVIPPSQ